MHDALTLTLHTRKHAITLTHTGTHTRTHSNEHAHKHTHTHTHTTHSNEHAGSARPDAAGNSNREAEQQGMGSRGSIAATCARILHSRGSSTIDSLVDGLVAALPDQPSLAARQGCSVSSSEPVLSTAAGGTGCSSHPEAVPNATAGVSRPVPAPLDASQEAAMPVAGMGAEAPPHHSLAELNVSLHPTEALALISTPELPAGTNHTEAHAPDAPVRSPAHIADSATTRPTSASQTRPTSAFQTRPTSASQTRESVAEPGAVPLARNSQPAPEASAAACPPTHTLTSQ